MELTVINAYNRKLSIWEIRLINRTRKALEKINVKFKCYEVSAFISIVFWEPLHIKFRICKSEEFWIQEFITLGSGIPLKHNLFQKNNLAPRVLIYLRICFFEHRMRIWRKIYSVQTKTAP